MRRTTRRASINLSIFIAVLLLVIYLNLSGPSRLFLWNRIRYTSPSRTFPEPFGVCPGLSRSSKPALVVSRVGADGEQTWLNGLEDDYHLCVYTVDKPRRRFSRHLQVPANRGHEAMAYLTFIVDNYDNLPPSGAVFVHGNRFAWHNDHPSYDNAALLKALNISRALEPHGYFNLKCDWSASTCDLRDSPPQGSLETSMRAATEPWNERVMSDSLLPRALATLFGGLDSNTKDLLLGRRDAVRSQCCAQFVVSKNRLLSHTKEEYLQLRQWLLGGTDDSPQSANGGLIAPRDDKIAGRIVSYLWHILFLIDSALESGTDLKQLNGLACPSASECYCRLYGRCDLPNCTEARCNKQYTVPPNYALPKDWATTHV